jgi:uncharacterized membrane protein
MAYIQKQRGRYPSTICGPLGKVQSRNCTDHAPRHTPQEVLADRLARGEIEPDDYRQRLDAFQHRQNE